MGLREGSMSIGGLFHSQRERERPKREIQQKWMYAAMLSILCGISRGTGTEEASSYVRQLQAIIVC